MIHSFPNSWEKMKLNMTHNERIQKLEDLSHNLELKAERRVVQGQSFAFFARHGHHQASKAKRKGHGKASEWCQDGRKPLKRANTTKRPSSKHGGSKQDKGVTEIESRDLELMDIDFPSRGDVGQNLKMVVSWDDTSTTTLEDSRREITPSGSVP
uniref:Uncharacterized protein n=1 Tax=Fagus sylvatica TaxID=28930 RepID=A0A2N9FAZ1_FAGSY